MVGLQCFSRYVLWCYGLCQRAISKCLRIYMITRFSELVIARGLQCLMLLLAAFSMLLLRRVIALYTSWRYPCPLWYKARVKGSVAGMKVTLLCFEMLSVVGSTSMQYLKAQGN